MTNWSVLGGAVRGFSRRVYKSIPMIPNDTHAEYQSEDFDDPD